MNYVDFARYRDFASLALAQAETVATKAGALCLRARPHVIQFAWDTCDSTIAAMAWTVELGMRFNDWTEDPQNKARVNRAAETISVYANRAFKIWCWGVSTAIDAAYRSRPYVKKAMTSGWSLTIALTKEGVTQAALLVRFLLALRMLLERLDWEEKEEYQTALPATPRPLALMAPAKVAQGMVSDQPAAIVDDPWIAPAENVAIATAAATVIAAETPLLLAAAPKTARASKCKSTKASGNSRKKTASSGRKPAKSDRKLAARRKVAVD